MIIQAGIGLVVPPALLDATRSEFRNEDGLAVPIDLRKQLGGARHPRKTSVSFRDLRNHAKPFSWKCEKAACMEQANIDMAVSAGGV